MNHRTFKKELKGMITAAEAAELKVTSGQARAIIASAIIELKTAQEFRDADGENIRDVEDKVKDELHKRDEEKILAELNAQLKEELEAWALEEKSVADLEKVEIGLLKQDRQIIAEIDQAISDSSKRSSIINDIASRLQDKGKVEKAVQYILSRLIKIESKQKHINEVAELLIKKMGKVNDPSIRQIAGVIEKINDLKMTLLFKRVDFEQRLPVLGNDLREVDNECLTIINQVTQLNDENKINSLLSQIKLKQIKFDSIIRKMEAWEQSFQDLLKREKELDNKEALELKRLAGVVG